MNQNGHDDIDDPHENLIEFDHMKSPASRETSRLRALQVEHLRQLTW